MSPRTKELVAAFLPEKFTRPNTITRGNELWQLVTGNTYKRIRKDGKPCIPIIQTFDNV